MRGYTGWGDYRRGRYCRRRAHPSSGEHDARAAPVYRVGPAQQGPRRWLRRSCCPAFGCLQCRVWSGVPASAFGTELPCPKCGNPVKLNPFVIEADWRPVAAAWRR